jgi:hypothetical protein
VYITSRGKLIRIISAEKSNRIRDSTAALSFPIYLNDDYHIDLPSADLNNTLIKKSSLHEEEQHIKVIYMDKQTDDCGMYKAMTKETLRRTRDQYIRVSEFDYAVNMHAFIFIRYAWGINITVAYLNVQENICYCLYVFNHDDPESLALKMENGELYSFDSHQPLDIVFDSVICIILRKHCKYHLEFLILMMNLKVHGRNIGQLNTALNN